MQLSCEQVVSGLGCDFVATGDTVDGVHDAMMAHGGEKHSDLMAGMSPEEAEKAGAEMSDQIKMLAGQQN